MNKREEQKLKAHTKRLCVWLRTRIFHGEYDMDIVYSTKSEPDKDLTKHAAAAMRINSAYLSCAIVVDMEHFSGLWMKKDYREIMRLLAHEFSHLLTEPLYCIAIDAVTNASREQLEYIREQQTQRIANIIMQDVPVSIYKRRLE